MAGLSTADCVWDHRNCMYYSVIRLRIKNPGWDWHLRINLIDLSIFYVTMNTMTELLTYIHILSHAYNPLFFLFEHKYAFQCPHNDATWFQEQQAGLHLWPMESDCFHKSHHEVQRYWKVTRSWNNYLTKKLNCVSKCQSYFKSVELNKWMEPLILKMSTSGCIYVCVI